ncbi:Os03g0129900, partial [Oryza sativa Japonica Group]
SWSPNPSPKRPIQPPASTHRTTNHRPPRRRGERKEEREMEAAAAAGVQLGTSKPQIATQAEMSEARLPLPYRDQCAHLLIPLNKCRVAEYYLPWKCEPERHAYEKCQYELVMERMIQMQKIREAQEAKSKGAATIGVPLIPSTAKLS